MKRPDLLLLSCVAVMLVGWTGWGWGATSAVLVAASLALAGISFWSCQLLSGRRAAWTFLATAVVLGWLAEQAGATRGWFFGDYSYTDVLGPRLGAVPIVIPFMWFGLCHIGLLMASLILWRTPAPPTPGWQAVALSAWLAAMVVTAFDLAADPYFVYQLKAWIMKQKDGGWFGETVRGFEGWMVVSFAIVAAYQLLARRPGAVAPALETPRLAALVPILLYAGLMVFQMSFVEPVALRVVAFFAMGIPVVAALSAWHQWRGGPGQALA